jgi:hypothetical protein
MQWQFYDEAIEMIEMRFRYLPHRFRWRGKYYRVHTVERSWTTSRRGRDRRYFRVQCGDGILDLYQDLRAATWHLRRRRPAEVRLSPARRIVPVWR